MRAIRHLDRTKQSAAEGRCAVVVTPATVMMAVVSGKMVTGWDAQGTVELARILKGRREPMDDGS